MGLSSLILMIVVEGFVSVMTIYLFCRMLKGGKAHKKD